ncbi:hypothetical protein DFR57_101381 [Saliterribacillus persicus]|uniref:Uncharacterized protein n=1 Tax=Saliterribacillus persicus TaxID=930114 RepID=A0A368YDT9_9BACI|nr:hypothetical protein DFR57_101381 [Saliterribacillus persicus]
MNFKDKRINQSIQYYIYMINTYLFFNKQICRLFVPNAGIVNL